MLRTSLYRFRHPFGFGRLALRLRIATQSNPTHRFTLENGRSGAWRQGHSNCYGRNFADNAELIVTKCEIYVSLGGLGEWRPIEWCKFSARYVASPTSPEAME